VSIDIWSQCQGINHIQVLNETAWRIVGTDGTAMRKLVDSYEEQEILENMINKPKLISIKENQRFHPLLIKPFEYRSYGSRFAKKSELGLWYGSLHPETTMAETAFYQFHFLRASEASYSLVKRQITLFSTKVRTEKAIKLEKSPFSHYTKLISAPDVYKASQQLGTAMRESAIQAFTYQSARDTKKSNNIALFTPKAFRHHKPDAKSFQLWHCIASDNFIEFVRTNSIIRETKIFSLNQFLVNGVLPFPAG